MLLRAKCNKQEQTKPLRVFRIATPAHIGEDTWNSLAGQTTDMNTGKIGYVDARNAYFRIVSRIGIPNRIMRLSKKRFPQNTTRY